MRDPDGRIVTFDLDHTLVRNAFASWVIPEIARRLARYVDEQEVARELRHRSEGALGRGDGLLAYDWQAHVDSAARTYGVEPGGINVAELVQQHSEPGKVQLVHPKTIEILSHIRRAGWRIAILTNGFRAYQEPVIQATGLWEVIDDLVTTDDSGYAKPDRRAFTAAFQGSTLAVHVGDRLDHDVQGARNASALSVLLRPDAPVTGLTSTLDATKLRALREYLTDVARTERAGDFSIDSWHAIAPDAVTSDLADLPSFLELSEVGGMENEATHDRGAYLRTSDTPHRE